MPEVAALEDTTHAQSEFAIEARVWRYSIAFSIVVLLLAEIFRRLFVCTSGGCTTLKGRQTPPQTNSDGIDYAEVSVSSKPVLAWSNLCVTTAGGKSLLHNLSGELCPGQLMGLIGPTGAGKTTLMDVLANRGLRGGAKASGSLLLGGHGASHITPNAYDEAVRYCQQFEILPATLSVWELLYFAMSIRNTKLSADKVKEKVLAHAPEDFTPLWWSEEAGSCGQGDGEARSHQLVRRAVHWPGQ